MKGKQKNDLVIPSDFSSKQIPLQNRIQLATRWFLKESTKNPKKFNNKQIEITKNLFICFTSPLLLRYVIRKINIISIKSQQFLLWFLDLSMSFKFKQFCISRIYKLNFLMSLQKKLNSLEEKYPNKLNKKYFHERLLIMYNLDSEQINDFFNILTNEGEKNIYFQDFAGLIQLIHSKRRKSSEIQEHRIWLSQKQCLFLQQNIENVYNINDLDNFKIEFSQILKKTNVDFTEWNDQFLSKLFDIINDYKKKQNDFNPILFIDGYFEISNRERLSSIHNQIQEEETPPQILQYIKIQLNYFNSQISKLKKRLIDNSLNSLYKDFLFFIEIVEEKEDLINTNFKDYSQIQQKNNQELHNRRKIINKQKDQISRLLEENNSIKSETDFLQQEKQKFKTELKNLQNELFNKDIEIQNQQLKQQEYIDMIGELKKTINNLNDQNKNLQAKINEIQNQYNNEQKDIIEDFQQTLKQQEQDIIVEENQKIEYEKQQSQQNLERLEKAQDQIQNLQKQLENFQIKNKQLNEKIEDMIIIQQQQDLIRKSQQIEHEDLNEINKYMTEYSIQSDSEEQQDDNIELSTQINCNLEIQSQQTSEEHSTNEKINLPQNMISQIKNIIGYKTTNRITELNIDYRKFKDFIFLCEKDYKKLYFLYYKQDKINILSPYNRSLIFQIKLEKIIKINFSFNNSYLMFIKYKNKKDVIETCLIESPMIDQLQEIILKSQKLKQDICETIEFFDIETNNNFNQHTINIFKNTQFQGFIKIYVNSLFADWKIYYLVLIDTVLIQIKFPQKIYYTDKINYMRSTNIYKLDNFSILKTQKGKSTPNIFALKLIDEKLDFIIATPSSYHYLKWMNSLYDIFNQQLISNQNNFYFLQLIIFFNFQQYRIILIIFLKKF